MPLTDDARSLLFVRRVAKPIDEGDREQLCAHLDQFVCGLFHVSSDEGRIDTPVAENAFVNLAHKILAYQRARFLRVEIKRIGHLQPPDFQDVAKALRYD